LLKSTGIVPEMPLKKGDLTLVFEDAEHILDEILADQNQSSVETEVLPKIKSSAKSAESFQKVENSGEIQLIPQNEALFEDNISNKIKAVKQNEQILSGQLDKTVYLQNAETSGVKRSSFLPIITSAFAILLLIGGIIFGVWFFSGTGEETASNSEAGKEIKPPDGMVYIKGGTFKMGGDSQEFNDGNFTSPPHEVTVRPFFMDVYEVTCEEYKKFIDATGYEPPKNWYGKEFPKGTAKFPVTNVTWDAANAYAKWAGKRLPTEAEWEFAARGTDGRLYTWGNVWQENQANANKINNRMVEVGTYKSASPFGIFDLIGNAWEWTATNLEPYPNGTMPKVKPNVDYKIIRGGSWESTSKSATTTRRGFYGARDEDSYANTSFRCVKDVVEK
jgi:formylglycine-generating enzyme required for sulfatase activity